MKKSTKIIMTGLLALGISGGVFAYGAHNHWGMNADDKAEFITKRVTKKLDLDETQQQNLQVLATDMLQLMEELKSGREAHMDQVQQMLSAPVLDQSAALKMIEQKTQAVNDRAPATIASLALFLDSLNPDQKSQLQSFVSDRMHHKRGHGH
ncbi:MAG: periplasmic heavy metal sensor [Aestuariibacter sp.]|nr:periplasmic heavy metal sensor [Aestuariibacter sp.]